MVNLFQGWTPFYSLSIIHCSHPACRSVGRRGGNKQTDGNGTPHRLGMDIRSGSFAAFGGRAPEAMHVATEMTDYRYFTKNPSLK